MDPESIHDALKRAAYLTFDWRPNSNSALQFAELVAQTVEEREQRVRKRGREVQREFVVSIGRVMGALLHAATSPDRWSFRSMKRENFSGEAVSFRTFSAVLKGLEDASLVETVRGSWKAVEIGAADFGGAPVFKNIGLATRFRLTAAGLKLAADAGIGLTNINEHFVLGLPRKPLVLRAARKRHRFGKIGGQQLKYYDTNQTRSLEDAVRRINEFLDCQHLEGGTHNGYRRVFNQGDRPGFNWNKGGRLYCVGVGSYQLLKKDERLGLRINDCPVVEIDVRASHLTILAELSRHELDVSVDPYQLGGLPRDIVKAWVTITLGHNKFHRRWPQDRAKKYLEECGRPMQSDFPIRAVESQVLKHLPFLRDWPSQTHSCFDLMYLESQAILGTMTDLMDQGQPSYSVHDSLIVQSDQEGLAIELMQQNFSKHCEVVPALKVRGLGGYEREVVRPDWDF